MTLCALAVPTQAAPDGSAPAQPVPPGGGKTIALAQEIDALLQADFLSDARVGVSVRDLTTGRFLYRRGSDIALNPASNIKLVTSAAALALLGPEHRYATQIYVAKDSLVDGVVKGDIYVRGSGDPQLVTADLYELAGELVASGVTRVTGGVVVDASRFDRDELPPGYDQKDEFASYRAMSGATSVNFNTFSVTVRPGATPGRPAIATIDPPVPGISLTNQVSTVDGWRRQVAVAAEPQDDGTVAITLTGTIGASSSPQDYRYPVLDPTRNAGEVLRLVLKQRGIKLGRGKIETRVVPPDAQLVATHFSPSLAVLLRSVNKLSNNFAAEQILKTLDTDTQPASFAGAVQRVHGWLEGLGIGPDDVTYSNGSGLYDTNLISADQMTLLLRRVHGDFRLAPDFVGSLAIMGADGTTRSRLEESPGRRFVRVKTGTLNEVSALSGYAGTLGAAPIAFSILMNDLGPGEVARARAVQDRIAEVLAVYAGSAERRGPKKASGPQ